MAALLAVTLCAQLSEAQALACSAMEMRADTSMEAMPDLERDAGGPASDKSIIHEYDGDATGPGECTLASGCVSASAIPTIEAPRQAFRVMAPVVDGGTRSITSRALSPDLPPPRL